jgi:predicted unusual protein kinase regulating ubiquinone biosynthesis (AarF/ABC1/UbiB family)
MSYSPEVRQDRSRYWRVIRFYASVFARLLLWEVILRRILGHGFVQRSATRRWQRIASGFRQLAVGMGGVLIKAGQFLSVRVDVLPSAVTDELSGLQDEVPPESLSDIQAVIESEYGRPIEQVFGWLAPQPEAAASLAQVHRARLLTGEEVVVKVQRPRIETLVETDLSTLQTAIGWLKRYGPIARRVNLDRLYEEFSQTTRRELDFRAEGENVEHFARDFQGDEGVRVPHVYVESSTRRVLVMENVASIKIDDFHAMEAAGIDRKAVSRRLFDTYLKQLFVHNFVHADPHPGNLFVQPQPPAAGQERSFRLVFVDFGMVATVPEQVRQHLREFLVGFATRDAARLVRAYQGAGVLLPGADVARIEQMEAEMMRRYAGMTMKQARRIPMSEWESLAHEYRDLFYEMPIQLPSGLLFIGRALAVLFGMATSLDPDFDPWQAIQPFAAKMAAEEGKRGVQDLLGEAEKLVRAALSLPGQADRFFRQASGGELTVRTRWNPEAMRSTRRIEVAVNRLAGTVVFASLLLAGAAVYVARGGDALSYGLFGAAGVALLVTVTRRA